MYQLPKCTSQKPLINVAKMNKTQIYDAIHSSFDGSNYKLEIKEASYYTCCILNIFSIQGLHKKPKTYTFTYIFRYIFFIPKRKVAR